MRRSTPYVLTALSLATIASACSESTSPTPDTATPLFATRTEHSNVRADFFLDDVDNPCTPAFEAIDLEGAIHGQGSVWDNDHFKSHYDARSSPG